MGRTLGNGRHEPRDPAAPLTVAGTIVKPATTSTSRYSRVVRIRHPGLYCAFVLVNNGPRISGHSRTILTG